MTINRSAHPDALWPGVFKWFGSSYKEQPELWREVFREETSDKHMEVTAESTYFGLAPTKAEGASITFDDAQQGYKNTYTHVVYGLGYIVTREEIEDNQYEKLSKHRARALSYSMRVTREFVCAATLNRAFSGTYAGGDGVAMISTAHPVVGATQSNRLTVDADLSEAAIEDALKIIYNMKDARGLPYVMSAKKLIVPVNEIFNANRYVNSNLRSGTANNDLNAIKEVFPEGIMKYRFLDDDDAWFIQTDVKDGLCTFTRRSIDFDKDEDFGTENARAKSTMRFSVGWDDWRGIVGSAGT